MLNGMYTVFIKKNGDEQLLVETTDKGYYELGKQWALENGYTITREYFPWTNLDAPDFAKTLNI